MGATTFLVIAVLANGGLQTESAYAMENLAECETISQHQAVIDSYPDRQMFCVETLAGTPPGGAFYRYPSRADAYEDTAVQPLSAPER